MQLELAQLNKPPKVLGLLFNEQKNTGMAGQ